jgi:mannose-6-phosphate isomerase-like protein (cupin superfamily)
MLFTAKLAGGVIAAPVYIAPLHIHHDDDEAWYVLEGGLAVRRTRTGTRRRTLRATSW